MNTTLSVKTILAAAALAVLATTAVPAEGFAAAVGRGSNGQGGASSGGGAGTGGQSSSGNSGHGGGGNALVIANTTDGGGNGDPQVQATEFPPTVGPPRRVRRVIIRKHLVRQHACAGRWIVDGDPEGLAFRACRQTVY